MFDDNDMSLDTLKELYGDGEDSLKKVLEDEMKISSFGHRHEIIDAVKKLPG